MKITTWEHENVNKDGVIIKDGRIAGAVNVEPSITTMHLTVVICRGVDNSTATASGVTIDFDSTEEMDKWNFTLEVLNHLKY